MTTFRLLCCTVLLNAPLRSFAQEQAPDVWKATDTQNAYRLSVDTQTVHGGKASGHVVATGPSGAVSMFVSQMIRAENFRGKRVRFTAFLRAANAGTAATKGAVLFLRAEGGGVTLTSYSTGNRPVGGNTDWSQRQIVLDIPAEAIGITFGFGMGGPGEIWMDDATFEVVGADVAVSRTPGKPPVAERGKAAQQIKQYANAPRQPLNMDFENAK